MRAFEVGASCPGQRGAATDAAARCFQEWLIARGTTGASEVEQGIEQVRRIERDGASRFVPIDDPFRTVPNRLGFIRRRYENEPDRGLCFLER